MSLNTSFSLSENDALFLDFDGTLAPIQDDPESVALPNGAAEILLALSNKLGGALALISGRGLQDLSRRVPQEVWRFGNHGLYAAEPGKIAQAPTHALPAVFFQKLETATAPFKAVHLEPKGPMVAIHYRQTPEVKDALFDILSPLIDAYPDFGLQRGKGIFEVKPKGANKGECLRRAMERPPFMGRRPVMIGDDTTDEDAFIVVNDLGGVSIKVGDEATCAQFRLADVPAVHKLLKDFL